MSPFRLAPGAALLALGLLVSPCAHAADFTTSGTLASDTSVVQLPFSVSAPTLDTFSTTSYAGGVNNDGSTTAAGGFDPVLALFTASGTFLAEGGGASTCGLNGDAATADAATGLCNDALFTQSLTSGDYLLTVSEFPNYPNGDLGSGFFLDSDPTLIADACGSSTPFLESDLSPCAARTGNYTVDVTGTAVTPEPATWLLVLPPAVALFATRRRRLL